MINKIDKRVEAFFAQAPLDLDPKPARLFFSWASHVEGAAVEYAKRINNPAQIEDETVHQELFKKIAESYGGLEPCNEKTQELLNWLSRQQGALGIALFGFVSETFIEGVFHHLAKFWPMFVELEKEERSHVEFAKAVKLNADQEAQAALADVEELILDVSRSNMFLLSINALIGMRSTAELGLMNVKNHEDVVRRLGLQTGPDMLELKRYCNAAIRACDRGLPNEVSTLNKWVQNKEILMNGHYRWMQDNAWMKVQEEDDSATIEAKTVKKVAHLLAINPDMNRTARSSKIHQPQDITIGVRRIHDKAINSTMTVYISQAHLKTVREIRQELKQKTLHKREQPYVVLEDFRGYEDMLPPARAAAVITNCGSWGVNEGTAAPIDAEGCAFDLCIGKPQWKPYLRFADGKPYQEWDYVCYVGCNYNHLLGDAREIGLLVTALSERTNV